MGSDFWIGRGGLYKKKSALGPLLLLSGGPLAVGGLSRQVGEAIGSRLIGLDLYRLLAAAPTVAQLLVQSPRPVENAGGRLAGAPPYHLLMYSWHRQFSSKSKRAWLAKVEGSAIPTRLGFGPRGSLHFYCVRKILNAF